MAASPVPADAGALPPRDNWAPNDEQAMHHPPGVNDSELANGQVIPQDDRMPPGQNSENPDYTLGSDPGGPPGGKGEQFREKQIKPNKIYIGGLPEHARQEDLQHCFGKLGNITNIELKVGYGFVEFDTREAADEAVAKYDEGFFMGNKIRVELSHGGGRTAKYTSDPGACFRCGMVGHWARECPNHPYQSGPARRDGPPSERPHREYPVPPPPPRDYAYREEYPRYPPNDRYRYDYPPPPGRDYRRPPSPPRDYRDYPSVPPRPARDYDDYRRGPPPPPHRYEARAGYYPPDTDTPPAPYPPRGYSGPPPSVGARGYVPPVPPSRDTYDRYDRRPGPPGERYPAPYSPMNARPRSPPLPGGPPRAREEFDRPPPRDYPPPDYRGRPASPRYGEYPPRTASPPDARYRRRSASPRPPPAQPYDPNYSNNGYPAPGTPITNAPVRPPPGSRDYPPRNGEASYRRP